MGKHHGADILALTQTQEYTAIASSILEAVLTYPQITSFAANLWQFLFNKAKFCQKLSITIAYSTLAKHFRVSERTVMRHIQLLSQEQFVVIQKNFQPDKGQLANTFFLTIPTELLDLARHKKDRQIVKTSRGADNFDRTADDKIVTQKENIKNKNINNNVVVQLIHKQQPTSTVMPALDEKPLVNLNEKLQLEQEITHLTELHQQTEANYLKSNKPQNKFEFNKRVSEILTAIELRQQKLNQLENHLDQSIKVQQAQQQFAHNLHAIANKPGERSISTQCLARMKSTLINLGFKAGTLNQLINQIVYEARFGSLVKAQQGQGSNPIEKAVNIGLKLVREGRWQTPGYNNFISGLMPK